MFEKPKLIWFCHSELTPCYNKTFFFLKTKAPHSHVKICWFLYVAYSLDDTITLYTYYFFSTNYIRFICLLWFLDMCCATHLHVGLVKTEPSSRLSCIHCSKKSSCNFVWTHLAAYCLIPNSFEAFYFSFFVDPASH